ncbi:MAG: lactamase [Dehalococcoidia bacterium]|nr:lactamase [Dehalococcoidia bacterium]
MEISWFGHSCFKLKGKGVTIITDPYDGSLGITLNQPGDIVTVSHKAPHHSHAEAVKGARKVISRPGEYEISGVFITGVSTFQDDQKGVARGKNTSYVIEMEDLRICHLGQIGHVPTDDQEAALGNIDILLVPVGGKTTIDAKLAAETIRQIEPRIAIPMHYKIPQIKADLDAVEPFLKELGLTAQAAVPKLVVTSTSLPPQLQVVVLDLSK